MCYVHWIKLLLIHEVHSIYTTPYTNLNRSQEPRIVVHNRRITNTTFLLRDYCISSLHCLYWLQEKDIKRSRGSFYREISILTSECSSEAKEWQVIPVRWNSHNIFVNDLHVEEVGITTALLRMECGYRKSTHINRHLQYSCSHPPINGFAEGEKIQKETNHKI